MSIKKIQTKDGHRFEVSIYTSGRGSKRLRRRFDKKIEAQEFLQSHMANTFQYKKGNESLSLLEEVIFQDEANFWIESNKSHFSASHLRRVKGVLKEIMPEFGNLTLDKFSARTLSVFQQRQLALGKAHGTVNRKTEVITSILNHSLNNMRIPYNPSRGFKKLPMIKDEVQFWSKEEAKYFLSFADKKYPKDSSKRWIYVVYLLALNTGLRSGEIWGLKPIDMENEYTLFIRRQFNTVTQDFQLLKGKRNAKSKSISRHVPCNQNLRSELKDLIRANKIISDQTIFQNENGRPIDHSNFRRIFLKDIKASNVKEIRFHDFRHTATTLMISSNIDLKTVQSILGHEDIKTTFELNW